MILKKESGWGIAVVVRLPCGHVNELLRHWIAPDGSVGRIGCTDSTCRRVYEDVKLEEWVGS